MANQLLVQLPKSKADTGRVRILFELGKYQLFKPGNVPADLDRSLSYLNQAKQLERFVAPADLAARNRRGTSGELPGGSQQQSKPMRCLTS